MDKTVCEIYLAINDRSDYAIGLDEYEARETLDNACGSGNAFRMIKLTVAVRRPKIELPDAIDIPDDAGTVEQVTAG